MAKEMRILMVGLDAAGKVRSLMFAYFGCATRVLVFPLLHCKKAFL